MLDFLITPANAQTAGGASAGFDFMGLVPLVVIFVAFYFFLIRPQQQKAQQQKNMLSAISKGDRVVTVGGIMGKVHSLENEMEVVIEVEGGVLIRMLKSSIVDTISAGGHSNVTKIKADDESGAKTKPRRPVSPKKSAKDKTVN